MTESALVLLILFGLFTKHFVLDFICQGPYQYLNKGTYGHPGGLLHSGLHAAGTMLILAFFSPMYVLLGLLDGVLHYHIDWAKAQINRRKGWKPENSEKFWWLLGLDQYLHYLTYLMICWILI